MKTLFLITTLIACIPAREIALHRTTPSDSPLSTDFTLVERRGNIALYERWFLYDSVTKAREIKLVFQVKTNLQSAVNLLRDEPNAHKWNLRTSQFRVVPDSDERWVNYIRYDLPWPLSDHDCVLQYNLQQPSSSTCIVSFETSSHSKFPKTEDASRLSDIRGRWLLKQHHDSVHIEYLVTTVPSSSLPRWVTDPIIRNNLLDTMVKFSKFLEALNN
ncbi:MAG TPA: hypothetical protein VGD40_08760 [Chryseosolibacter sp.]